jgi:hypothetical protein
MQRVSPADFSFREPQPLLQEIAQAAKYQYGKRPGTFGSLMV